MINKNDKLKFANLRLEQINNAFIEACERGDLDTVKFLLLEPRIIHPDITSVGGDALIKAGTNKHNHIVQFLIEGKELDKHVSINTGQGALLGLAVYTHNTELMDYLLNHTKNKKMNLNQNQDKIFISLMWEFNKHQDIIKLLITDYHLQRTQAIQDFLDQKNHGIQEKQLVSQWFDKRDTVETLRYVFQEDSTQFTSKPKKKKI